MRGGAAAAGRIGIGSERSPVLETTRTTQVGRAPLSHPFFPLPFLPPTLPGFVQRKLGSCTRTHTDTVARSLTLAAARRAAGEMEKENVPAAAADRRWRWRWRTGDGNAGAVAGVGGIVSLEPTDLAGCESSGVRELSSSPTPTRTRRRNPLFPVGFFRPCRACHRIRTGRRCSWDGGRRDGDPAAAPALTSLAPTQTPPTGTATRAGPTCQKPRHGPRSKQPAKPHISLLHRQSPPSRPPPTHPAPPHPEP